MIYVCVISVHYIHTHTYVAVYIEYNVEVRSITQKRNTE